MRKMAKPVLGFELMMRAFCVTTFLALAACQTYDFERVEPLAIQQTTQSEPIGGRQLKPNLMLLLDKSGSMASPISASAPQCPPGCGSNSPCPMNCPTRISELRSSMAAFLPSAGTIARMGLALFPFDKVCAVPTELSVPLPRPSGADDQASNDANVAQASVISAAITAATPNGGTPTNLSLRFVGRTEGLNQTDNRQDFVLLLTDGVPNCNEQNANNCCADDRNCAAPNPCACTTATGSCVSGLCALGCLDRQGVVEAVQELRSKNIKTIVIGFGIGAELSADQKGAPDSLNSMAEAGGFARACTDNNSCGPGDRCTITAGQTTGVCNQKYYRATNGSELSAALKAISDGINNTSICERTLETQPQSEKYLAVIVDGVNQSAGPDTWSYTGGKVVFVGSSCERLKAATINAPIKVEIRIVKVL